MKEEEMRTIGRAITAVLKGKGDPAVREKISRLCEQYPLHQQGTRVR